MESIFFLANLCKFSYKGVTYPGHDFSTAKVFEVGSSKMISIRKQKSLIFCVTGTDSIDDMILDTDIRMTNLIVDGKKYGRVHRGFYTYIQRLWPYITAEIDKIIEESPLDTNSHSPICNLGTVTGPFRNSLDEENSMKFKIDKRQTFKIQRFRASLLESMYVNIPMIVFTGHSLGSCCSIAALLAVLKYGDSIKVRCITFASPKIGDRDWVRSYHDHVVRNFRVVHNNDVVTMLPFGSAYKHLNDEVKLGSDGGYLLRHKSFLHVVIKSFACADRKSVV